MNREVVKNGSRHFLETKIKVLMFLKQVHIVLLYFIAYQRFFNLMLNPLNIYIYIVFTSGLGELGSIPGHVIPNTLKMVLDTSLLNTQQYKVRMKGKVE